MNLRYGYLALVLTFLLGVQDGFIALWHLPEAEPVCVFPYSAASLSPYDRQKLENGIRAESCEELMHLLEDYLS